MVLDRIGKSIPVNTFEILRLAVIIKVTDANGFM